MRFLSLAFVLVSGVAAVFWPGAEAAAADGALFAPPSATGAAAPAPEPRPATEPESPLAPPKPAEQAKAAAPKASARKSEPGGVFGSGRVLVDSKGNKTLVIKGSDDAPAEVMMAAPSGQTQVIFGDDTAGLIMDSQGRKTLVVKGDAIAAPQPLMVERPKGSADTAYDLPSDVPYWVVEAPVADKPYFQVEPDQDSTPYWLADKKKNDTPYWEQAKVENDYPYWLPEPVHVELVPNHNAVTVASSSVSTSAASSSSAIVDGKMSISYYMYQDERGVKHLTNAPKDSRYRLFTVVVQVKRGLGGGYYGKQRFTHESLRPIIMKAAVRYNLDPALIAAVIKSESAFDARAVSWAGAQGLMQLMPRTAKDMGVSNSFDPEQNIMGGSRYLRLMLDEFGGDLRLAIAAYNAGPNRVKRNWAIPNIAETKNYVVIVLRNYERYKGQI